MTVPLDDASGHETITVILSVGAPSVRVIDVLLTLLQRMMSHACGLLIVVSVANVVVQLILTAPAPDLISGPVYVVSPASPTDPLNVEAVLEPVVSVAVPVKIACASWIPTRRSPGARCCRRPGIPPGRRRYQPLAVTTIVPAPKRPGDPTLSTALFAIWFGPVLKR